MTAAVIVGVAADAAFGDPRRGHPVALFGSLAARFERVCYRPTRRAGAVYAAILVGGAAALGALLERLLPRTLVRAVALWVALGGRSLAREAGALAVATGRSDYPNQVNNSLAFPGVFRGALDVKARDVNDEMKIAAAHAIADTVKLAAIVCYTATGSTALRVTRERPGLPIIGLTPVGRGTVQLLKMNAPLRIELRRELI